MTQEQSLKKYNEILSVHHIDGDDTNNVDENMIIFCKGCHKKLHLKLMRGKNESNKFNSDINNPDVSIHTKH